MPTQLIRFLVLGPAVAFVVVGSVLSCRRLVSFALLPDRGRHLSGAGPDHGYLDDLLLKEGVRPDVLWIVSWGFDVPG